MGGYSKIHIFHKGQIAIWKFANFVFMRVDCLALKRKCSGTQKLNVDCLVNYRQFSFIKYPVLI